MIEWVLGISVWILLVSAVYLFFRNKFEEVGELFEEDVEEGFEDDYEETEEFEESGQAGEAVWVENSEAVWEENTGQEGAWSEGAGQEDAWSEGAGQEDAWSEGAWEESAGQEGAWSESAGQEGAWDEGAGQEDAWSEGAWEESAGQEDAWSEGAWEESAGQEGAWGEGAGQEDAWDEGAGQEDVWSESAGQEDVWSQSSWESGIRSEASCEGGGQSEGSRNDNTWAGEDIQVYYPDRSAPRKNGWEQDVSDEDYIEDGQNKNRKKEGRKAGIFGKLVIPLALVGAVYFLLPYYCVRREMTIDAGEKCPGVEAFLKWGNKNARYVSAINESTVLDRAGDYGVLIEVYGRRVAAVLHVDGTTQPHIATKKLTIFSGESVRADDFVEEVEGITPVDIRFAKEPDCATGGINTVLLEIEDEIGDVMTAEALLEVIDDTEPPVIHGVGELTMTVGGSVSYKKGVTVTDNYDQDVKLNVDSSEVNVDKEGDYRVIYTAVDSAGNRTSVSTVLHVQPMTIDTVTEESIYMEADKLLEKILTDSMSQYEQAQAIYDWCHENIAYSDGTPKTNWVQGAYRGLVNRKGDCYVYAATAKCLLTRAGIKNMDIEKIPAKSMHYWNLIDIGDGWHHFDACRRKDGSTFFYKTDAELMEYSNTHNKSHNYDRSLYPDIM